MNVDGLLGSNEPSIAFLKSPVDVFGDDLLSFSFFVT